MLTVLFSGFQDVYEFREFQGEEWLTISVELSGGKGDVAWQHAQLFRQALNDKDFPFVVNFTFKTNDVSIN